MTGVYAALLAIAGLTGVFSASAAHAADHPAPAYKAAAPVQIYNWSGFYGGLNFGSVIGQSHARSAVPANDVVAGADVNDAGLTGGVQAGINWQFTPTWLVGLEGDFGYLGARRSNTDWFDGITIGQKASWYATARARTGHVTGPSLLYVTGGAAFVRMEETFGGNTATGLAPATSDTTRTGWTAGAGIETKLSRNWSAKTEYLYIATGTHNFAANPYGIADTASFKSQFHMVKAGLNYNFGGGKDAPLFNTASERDWAGFYLGANSGLGVSATHITGIAGPRGAADINGSGFAGGIQAGYNVMLGPNWFAGLEADAGFLDIDRSFQDWGDVFEFAQKTDWYGTLRGRAGWNTGAALLYATAGGAAVRVKNAINNLNPALPGSSTETATGWTVGGGTEVALNSRWSAKVEALYIDVGNQRAETTNGLGAVRAIDFDRRFQVIRAGLNYKLN
jgi:outer membrane immunogenic protein